MSELASFKPSLDFELSMRESIEETRSALPEEQGIAVLHQTNGFEFSFTNLMLRTNGNPELQIAVNNFINALETRVMNGENDKQIHPKQQDKIRDILHDTANKLYEGL